MSEDSNSGQEDAATSLDSDSKMSRWVNVKRKGLW